MSGSRPIKVAVIGGGCASIAAAFELSRPEHAGRYQVTVYQLGWRLGGKAASGRGMADRIEEHGLHMWMGFYENAFALIRQCYAELGRNRATCPIADWRDAFEPVPLIGIAEQGNDGSWAVWRAALPATEGFPGDPLPEGRRFTMGEYVGRATDLLRALLGTIGREPADESLPPTEPGREAAPGAPAVESVADTVSRMLAYGELASLAALTQAISLLEIVFGSLARYPENLILRFIDAIASNARALLQERLASESGLRRVWEVIDVTLATLRGEVRFGIFTDPRGFDVIDEYDCREWLLLNGASEDSVNSGFIRALYDLGLAYEDGEPSKPRVSAAQGLRSMVRAFFTYRGSFFWRMNAGMGDTVFAPFYQVLERRGVRFEFFHRLEKVRLAGASSEAGDAESFVAALDFDVQAHVRGGAAYRPLIDVRGLPCWPGRPDYGQLVDGDLLAEEGRDFESFWDRRRVERKTLRVKEDFDFVVLGVGLGAIPHVCAEIVARNPRWRSMVDHVATVATQAFQLWMDADMEQLGWPGPAIALCGFVEPFDTWADMRHLIAAESWRTKPRSLAYFCNVLPDLDDPAPLANPEYPLRQRDQVRQNAIRFLNEDLPHLWPRATRRPGEFDWGRLLDAEEGRDLPANEKRFTSQFWTANVNPSDRYTLALPGTSAYRISPLDTTYDNLTICGDWTSCGFNAGCVEAAVMSGRLAAHAISLLPRLEDIIGYDHP